MRRFAAIASLVVLVVLVLMSPTRASAAPGLPAPVITSAAVTSATSIEVEWTAVDRAVGYEIRLIAFEEVQFFTTTETSARLTVFPSTPYTVEVRALGRNVVSPWTEPVLLVTPPAPPSSVVAEAVRPDLVLLSWDTGHGHIGYEVFAVAPDGTHVGPLPVRELEAPNRVLIASEAETTSRYVVVAIGFDGQRSVPSEVVTVTTPPRWPSEVVIFLFGPVDEGRVTLTTGVRTSPDDSFVSLGGEVTYTIDSGVPQTVPVVGGSATLDVELAAGTYEVTAAWTGDSAYLPSSTSAVLEVRPVLVPFSEPEVLPATGEVRSAAIGDVTGDRRPDLATVSAVDTANVLEVRAGQADGTLAAPTSRSLPAFADRVALGDLDRDGDADAAVAAQDGVLVLAGSPTGLGAPSLRRTSTAAIDVAVADVTADGLPDVVVGTMTSLQVLPGTGRLTTGRARTIASEPVFRVQVGNATGDARLEIAGATSAPDGNATVAVWTPSGTGWAAVFREQTTGVNDIALGDVTGDGLVDLAWTAPAVFPDRDIQLRVGPGFASLAVPFAPQLRSVGTGDLDGDGRDNLVGGPDSWWDVQVWRVMPDEVSPVTPVPLGQPALATDVVVEDISGDGRDDLVVVDLFDGIIILRQVAEDSQHAGGP
jgi:FG-GAP-like repeat